MKNNQIFIIIAIFMALDTEFAVASDFQFFYENEALLMDDESNDTSKHEELQGAINNESNEGAIFLKRKHSFDSFLMGFRSEKTPELDGDFQAIFADSSSTIGDKDLESLRQSKRIKKSVILYSDDYFKQSYAAVPEIKKEYRLQTKELNTTTTSVSWDFSSTKDFKFAVDPDERQKQRAAILRQKQRDAAYIIKEGNLLQYSLEEQQDIKINADRYNRKRFLQKGYAERDKKLAQLVAIQKQTK